MTQQQLDAIKARRSDWDFIFRASEDIDALIAEVERLRAGLENMQMTGYEIGIARKWASELLEAK